MSASSEMNPLFAERRLLEYQNLAAACDAAEIMRLVAGEPMTDVQIALGNVVRAHVRLAKAQLAIQKNQSGSVEP